MSHELFIRSVEHAVTLSTHNNKCLIVYNTDSEDDTALQDDWFHKHFNPIPQEQREKAVWLKLVKGTQEFQYFEQIFPNVLAPSLYVIYQGQIRLILKDDGSEDYKLKLENTLNSLSPNHNDVDTNNNNTGTSNITTTSTSTTSSNNSNNEALTRDQKHDTFKEKVQETTQQIYREEVQKERRLAREERERILKLVQADKEERRARKQYRQQENNKSDIKNDHDNQPHLEIPDLDVQDNIKDRSKLHTAKCTLQIKLTDSHTLRHTFESIQTLNDVRKWVDLNRTDDDVPYAFHRNFPRTTFQDSDELKTLESLELTPRSVLILKPLETKNKNINIAEIENPGLFGKVYNGFSSWWNQSQNQNQNPTENSENSVNDTTITTTTSNNNNHFNEINNLEPLIHGALLNSSNSRINLARQSSEHLRPSRSLTPNVYQFYNADADNNLDDDNEKETYNGNTIKLEKRDKDDDTNNTKNG